MVREIIFSLVLIFVAYYIIINNNFDNNRLSGYCADLCDHYYPFDIGFYYSCISDCTVI